MTPALVLLAALVAVGGTVAVSAREPRLAALGLFGALVGSAYVADPQPEITALAARLTGSVLASYLVWVALRRPPAPSEGWRIGWPGAAAVAATAFAAGWLAANALGAGLAEAAGDGPSAGGVAVALASGSLVPRAAIAAAFALIALASGPVLAGRDTLRLCIGLMLLIAAAGLVRNALAPDVDSIVELAMAVLLAVAGAAAAAVLQASLRIHGDLSLHTAGARSAPIRHRSPDEAHPGRIGGVGAG